MRIENGTTLIHCVTKNIMRMGNSTNITHSCYSFKIVMSWFISHTQQEGGSQRVAIFNGYSEFSESLITYNYVYIYIYNDFKLLHLGMGVLKNETMLIKCFI